MFRLIVVIACLLIIDEFALGLRRRYLEHRQLRWWEKRIVRLSPAPSATQATSLDPIFKLPPEEEAAGRGPAAIF